MFETLAREISDRLEQALSRILSMSGPNRGLGTMFGEKLAEQSHRIDPDRQGDRDIFIHAQLTLAGFVARDIGLLPSEPLREVDLTKHGVPPCYGQRSDNAGVQV
ncbi:MAG: hypothetical protein PGN16_19755 [Sphingomonas phyllosphaerae]